MKKRKLTAVEFIRKCVQLDECPCCGEQPMLYSETTEAGFKVNARCKCGLTFITEEFFQTEEEACDVTIAGWNRRVYA